MKVFIISEKVMKWLENKYPNAFMYVLYDEETKEIRENMDFLMSARIITGKMRYEVLKRQKWRCNQCGLALKYNLKSDWEGEIGHIDHIHPFSKRASYKNGKDNISELSNLQALCPKCNKTKSNKECQ